MSEMTSQRRTILTLLSLAVVLVAVTASAVWILDGGLASGPRKAAARATARLEALKAGLEAAAQYVAGEKDDQASLILEKLAEEYPKEPLVWQQLAEVRLHQGREAEAYEMMKTVISLGHGDHGVCFNAGVIAAKLDRVDEAIIHLEEACRIDPTDVQAPLYLANLYRTTHENTRAQEQLLRVIQIDDSQHFAWGGLAQIAFVENKLDLAEQHLAKARNLAPQFATWQILQAKVLRRRGKPDTAITLLAALGPERYQQEVVDEIAQCWALMGLPLKAAQEHVEYLNRKNDALPSAIAASRFFLLAGRPADAESWWRYAQRLSPDSPEVLALTRQFEERESEDK